MADQDWRIGIENRMTKMEEALVGLTASIGTLVAAIVGTTDQPGVGLQIRVDRLERVLRDASPWAGFWILLFRGVLQIVAAGSILALLAWMLGLYRGGV